MPVAKREQASLPGMKKDDIEPINAMSDRRSSVLMYDRGKQGANLDEFKIIKNIGEGACGKVFLVQH